MKILLICGGGITTSIMVCMMENESNGQESIEAKSYGAFMKDEKDYDVVLVAPQIKFYFESISKICQENDISVGCIPTEVYGKMDGKKVLELAYQLVEKKLVTEEKKEKESMKSLKITLACAGGISTSMLVQKIVEEAKKQGYTEVECNAYGADALGKVIDGSDVVLLGPQIAYQQSQLSSKFPGYNFEVISMADYGMMNGSKVFNDMKKKYNW